MMLADQQESIVEMQAAAASHVAAGRQVEAATAYLECLNREPENEDLLYEYGELLLSLGRLEEAADCFRRILANNPAEAATILLLARTLHRLKRPKDALHYYRQGQRLAPDFAVVHLMAGITALESDQRDEARIAFRRVLEIDPENLSAKLCLCMSLLDMFPDPEALEAGRGKYAEELLRLVQDTRLDTQAAIDGAVEAIGMLSTFFLPYQGKNDRELQKIYGQWVSNVMTAKFPQFSQLQSVPLAAGEKLRVGIVSGHIFNHSVWKIVARGWCKYLDHSRFMLFIYYTGDVSDAATDDARSYADVFVRESAVADMAEIISRHRPHLLIYPGLSMDQQTIRLAALRLAPVQCVSWGHPETTGLPTMDYFLSSDLMEPPDGDAHYTEQLVRLPNLSVCYEPLSLPAELPPTQIPGVTAGDISFLCCQNLMKYLPQYDDVFAAIAAQVPRAKFVFLKFSASQLHCFKERMQASFGRYGLSADAHLIFFPLLNPITYAVLNAEIDIYLDSIGWSGGNTTFESLPFNKPIVTMAGEFMRGRHTAAILRMMGVDETVAADRDEYVRIAVRLANDTTWRAAVSARIAANKDRAYGDLTCVRALERFMEQAVRAATASGVRVRS